MSTFNRTVVLDGKGHILGRLAAHVAKEALSGKKVVVVRCEELLIQGKMKRNKEAYESYLRKRMNTNPRKGPFHHRAPSQHLYKIIRAMVSRKTEKGRQALARLELFDGVPAQYNQVKRFVCPSALAVTILKPSSPVTRVGDLLKRMGWKYHDVVVKYEEQRKQQNQAYVAEVKTLQNLKSEATEQLSGNTEFQTVVKKLAELGY
ncbi:predicted protein [Naegleria gruberi]|uniref:Predicted protein n=1 Tax=Naegleria gruberi TaxID=5762 RepID=D2VHC8_NAEGR|nr:uncharacterized protein NAEGRDRAFT_83175 [Naegleria gruberi]EFC43865.1 predicted protein [Naegleria gruberi]|eukprot:XP_002676609.1 predicted protein [Naegleria gruberi strain NEG-M]